MSQLDLPTLASECPVESGTNDDESTSLASQHDGCDGGAGDRCQTCAELFSTPSVADEHMGSTVRSRRATSPHCSWCEQLSSLLKDGGILSAPAFGVKHVPVEHSMYLKALFSLVTNDGGGGVPLPLTFRLLEERRLIFQKLFPSGESHSSRPSSASAASSRSCRTSSASEVAAKVSQCDGGEGMVDELAAADGADCAAPTVSPAHQAEAVGVGGGPVERQARVAEAAMPPAIAAGAGGGGDGPGVLQELAGDVRAEPLSIDGKFPGSSILSTSLKRIRGTINSYVDSVTQPGFFETFRPGTIKALERRLNQHECTVRGSHHVDSMSAFEQMQGRVQGLLAVHRVLQHWVNGKADSVLETMTKNLSHIAAYLIHEGKDFAGDLYIAIARCRFSAACTKGSRIHQAYGLLDMESLKSSFQEADKYRTESATIKEEEEEEEEEEEKAADAGDAGVVDAVAEPVAKNRFIAKVKTNVTPLTLESRLVDVMSGMVDRALQLQLYKVSAQDDTYQSDCAVVAADVGLLANRFRADFGGETCNFGSILAAIAIVHQCSAGGDSSAVPAPTDVRSARHLIHQVAKNEVVTFLSAKSMSRFEGSVRVMEAARKVGELGLLDTTADMAFESTKKALGDVIDLEQGDLQEWALTANEGKPFDIVSYLPCLTLVQRSAADIQASIGQWSAARLEQQADALLSSLGYLSLLVDFANYVAATELTSIFATWASGDESLASPVDGAGSCGTGAPVKAGQTDVDDTVVKTEPPAGDDNGNAGRAQMDSLCDLFADGLVSERRLHGLSAAVSAMRPQLDIFMRSASARNTEVGELAAALSSKLGDTFAELVEKEGISCPTKDKVVTDGNHELFTLVLDYLTDIAVLGGQVPVGVLQASSSVDCVKYMDVLAKFCMSHKKLNTGVPVNVRVAPEVAEIPAMHDLGKVLMAFVSEYGEICFNVHATPTVQACVGKLEADRVVIQPVERSAIDQCQDLQTVLAMIIQSPTVAQLGVKELNMSSTESIRCDMQGWRHNVLRAGLVGFVDSIGLECLTMHAIHKVSADQASSPSHVPVARAMLFFEVSGLVRDTAGLAATVQTLVVDPLAKGASIDSTQLLNRLPHVLDAFAEVLTSLDTLLSSPAVSAMEGEGYRLPDGFAALRIWAISVGVFRGKVVNAMVQEMSKLVDSTTTSVKSMLPLWESCITSSEFKENLAANLLKGRLDTVVRAHDTLYKTLQNVSHAASVIGVRPRIQENEITASSVQVALHVLGSARTACTVVDGVRLLCSFRHHRDGASAAKKFLDSHPYESRSQIPNTFWAQFTMLAADGSASAASSDVSPCSKKGSRPRRVKLEAVSRADTKVKLETVPEEPAESSASTAASSSATGPQLKRRRL